MKNRHEENAARCHKALDTLDTLLEEVAATTPPQPRGRHRYMRKVTPALIRRNIAGLRAGTMRPMDPNLDPLEYADKFEAELELVLLLERLVPLAEAAAGSISAMIENETAKTMEEAMELYLKAREMARTSDDELLKEHVRRMDQALGRGERR